MECVIVEMPNGMLSQGRVRLLDRLGGNLLEEDVRAVLEIEIVWQTASPTRGLHITVAVQNDGAKNRTGAVWSEGQRCTISFQQVYFPVLAG